MGSCKPRAGVLAATSRNLFMPSLSTASSASKTRIQSPLALLKLSFRAREKSFSHGILKTRAPREEATSRVSSTEPVSTTTTSSKKSQKRDRYFLRFSASSRTIIHRERESFFRVSSAPRLIPGQKISEVILIFPLFGVELYCPLKSFLSVSMLSLFKVSKSQVIPGFRKIGILLHCPAQKSYGVFVATLP